MLLPMTKLLIMSSVCLFIKKFTHFFWRKYHLFLTFHIMPEKQKEKINSLIAFINSLVNIIFVFIVLVAKNHHLLFVIVKEKVDVRR